MITEFEKKTIKGHIMNLSKKDLDVIATCANLYNVDIYDVFSRNRKKELVNARKMASYYFYNVYNYSLRKIGDRISIYPQNHVTVRNAVIKFKNHLQTEPKTAHNYSLLITPTHYFTSLKYKPNATRI